MEEAVEVRGKAGILFRVAEAAVGRPEGVVREVIFPAAGEQHASRRWCARPGRSARRTAGACTPRCAPPTAPTTAA